MHSHMQWNNILILCCACWCIFWCLRAWVTIIFQTLFTIHTRIYKTATFLRWLSVDFGTLNLSLRFCLQLILVWHWWMQLVSLFCMEPPEMLFSNIYLTFQICCDFSCYNGIEWRRGRIKEEPGWQQTELLVLQWGQKQVPLQCMPSVFLPSLHLQFCKTLIHHLVQLNLIDGQTIYVHLVICTL